MNQLRQNPSASALLDQDTAYQRVLEHWSGLRETRGNLNPLVTYILKDDEGEYKHLRLFYDTLRRNHRHKAQFLQQQCIKSKVCFWLARLSSSIDSSRHGASEPIFQLDKITELDGTSVVQGTVTIGKEDIVDPGSFECRKPYDSDSAEVDSASGDNVYHFKDRVCCISASTIILSSRPRRFSLPSRQRVSALSAAPSGFCKPTLFTSQ